MIDELTVQDRILILESQRRGFRVELEQLKNQDGLATFLEDKEMKESVRKNIERIMKAIGFFDEKIETLKKEVVE